MEHHCCTNSFYVLIAMKNDSIPLVNRLIAMHRASLPVYLCDAVPFVRADEQSSMDVVEMIAADQVLTAGRLADALMSDNRAIASTGFPAYFSGFHDLAFEYLLREMVRLQTNDVAEISNIVAKLSTDPAARPLAEEALGAAKGHLESMGELMSCSSN